MNSERPPSSPSRENVLAVYRRIRRMILSGKLKGGQAISQVQLALDFETSRGPVREALRMLQQEGFIEAETNQQGRIVSYSIADMEQVCALLVLNVALAIRAGADQLTAQDMATIRLAITRIEDTPMDGVQGTSLSPQRAATRRRLAFRRLVTVLCRHGGRHATSLINDLLDRVVMFRQLHEATGVSPPYPLENRFADLTEACHRRDAVAMAGAIVAKIADLAHKALTYLDKNYQPSFLDLYVAAARASLAPLAVDDAGAVTMTIRVRGLPGSRVECVIVPD